MDNQLEVIVKESQLEPTKAQYILDNFKSYFEIAAEWEAKAKTLVVTRDDQKAEMQMARTGRLFLREKRLAVENSRKKLKEESLREGKAIDGIANVLKALIVPIEEHLDRQERFIEIKREEKEAAEKEKALILERKKRDAELEAQRMQAAEERKKQEAVLAKERAKAEAEIRQAAEEKRLIERKAEEAKIKAAEVARKKLEAERKEKERLEAELKAMIECPKCHHKFNQERK